MKPARTRSLTVGLGDGDTAELAAWSRRFVARAIDSAVLAAYLLVAVVVSVAQYFSSDRWLNPAASDTYYDIQWWLREALWILPVVLYELVMTAACRGRTFGKMLASIEVVSISDGLKPTLGQMFARWLVPAAAGILGGAMAMLIAGGGVSDLAYQDTYQGAPLLGAVSSWVLVHLSSLWSPDGRGWPDRAAGTVVIRV